MIKTIFFGTIVLFSLGCQAVKHQPILSPWPKSQSRLQDYRMCRLKGEIKGKIDGKSFFADFVLRLVRDRSSSELSSVFSGPLGQNLGRLEVVGSVAQWIDAEGSHDIAEQPILKRWIREGWQEEIAFLFGIVETDKSLGIFKDHQGRPRLFEKAERRIECDYESEGRHPVSCLLSEKGLRSKFNFSSVQCEDSL